MAPTHAIKGPMKAKKTSVAKEDQQDANEKKRKASVGEDAPLPSPM